MRYLLVLVVTALAGCHQKPETDVSYYYDTDSLMVAQKEQLLERNARIIKKAQIDEKEEQGKIHPDSSDAWSREFMLFEKININKPVLKDVYEVREYDDSRSNLKVREYYSDDEGTEVPYLKIYYLGTPANLRKIEAKYVENNPIYHSQRYLTFHFDDFTGLPLLHRYVVRGSQKMIFRDSVSFSITGQLKL